MPSIVIADDHPIILQGVSDTLRSAAGFEVVATATSHDEALAACVRYRPDLVLLDLNMPGGSPIATVERLQEQAPATRIVVYSGYDDEIYVRGLLARGVSGYILKEESARTLVAALRTICKGGHWYSPAITQQLVESAAIPAIPPPLFSERERELLTLLVQGLTDQEIAAQLSLSSSTVRYHLSNLFERLGLASRVALAVEAVRQGWLD